MFNTFKNWLSVLFGVSVLCFSTKLFQAANCLAFFHTSIPLVTIERLVMQGYNAALALLYFSTHT